MKLHENPQKSDTSIFFNFHDPGYRKIRKNQTLRFSSTFMTPGTWKFTKIRRFDSIQFSWPRVQENPQKSDASIFFNFHDPGYMQVHKNQTFWFYSIFMTLGTGKSTKIRRFDSIQFSWTRVHKNPTLRFSSTFMTPGTWKSTKSEALILFNFHDPGYMKIHKNQTLWFSSTFITPITWKFTKIRRFDSIQFSCTQGHENWIELKCLIFVDFHVPGVMKIE